MAIGIHASSQRQKIVFVLKSPLVIWLVIIGLVGGCTSPTEIGEEASNQLGGGVKSYLETIANLSISPSLPRSLNSAQADTADSLSTFGYLPIEARSYRGIKSSAWESMYTELQGGHLLVMTLGILKAALPDGPFTAGEAIRLQEIDLAKLKIPGISLGPGIIQPGAIRISGERDDFSVYWLIKAQQNFDFTSWVRIVFQRDADGAMNYALDFATDDGFRGVATFNEGLNQSFTYKTCEPVPPSEQGNGCGGDDYERYMVAFTPAQAPSSYVAYKWSNDTVGLDTPRSYVGTELIVGNESMGATRNMSKKAQNRQYLAYEFYGSAGTLLWRESASGLPSLDDTSEYFSAALTLPLSSVKYDGDGTLCFDSTAQQPLVVADADCRNQSEVSQGDTQSFFSGETSSWMDLPILHYTSFAGPPRIDAQGQITENHELPNGFSYSMTGDDFKAADRLRQDLDDRSRQFIPMPPYIPSSAPPLPENFDPNHLQDLSKLPEFSGL